MAKKVLTPEQKFNANVKAIEESHKKRELVNRHGEVMGRIDCFKENGRQVTKVAISMSAIDERQYNGYFTITIDTLRKWVAQAEQLEKDGEVWVECNDVQITRKTKEEEKKS